METFLVSAIILGLGAGFAPGPLLTLTISESLRHGRGAGIRVAMAPLFSDAPIVAGVLLGISWFREFDSVIGAIALFGAAFVMYLGIDALRVQPVAAVMPDTLSRSLLKGVVANLANPAPYLFWLGVGAPQLFAAWDHGWVAATGFIVIFYFLLVGCKVMLAFLVAHWHDFLRGWVYIYLMRGIGLALCGLSLRLAYDGYQLF